MSRRKRLDPVVEALVNGKLMAMDRSAFDSLSKHLESLYRAEEKSDMSSFLFLFDDDEPTANDLDVRDGVAYVPVVGPLVDGESYRSYFSGQVTGYSTIAAQLSEARDRDDVRAVALDVSSPGGAVVGVTGAVDAVRAASASMPVYAFGPYIASAAYWIASAADSLEIDRNALIGSIGVIARYVDYSGFDQKRGVVFGQVVSSNAPNKRSEPVDDEVIDNLQREVDAIEDVFVEDVAFGRYVSPDTVREGFGRGGLVVGADAVARGMADGIGSIGEVAPALGGPEAG